MNRIRTAAQIAVVLLVACGRSSDTASADSHRAGVGHQVTIAVIPKGTSHEFWKSVHEGALQAERELQAAGEPVHVIWKGPLREDDRELQVQVVEGFVSQGANGIVLAPLDDRALVRPVEEARNAGVPTVIIDSDLRSDSIVSFVATDNLRGGQLAADRLAELLGGKGNVLMLRYAEGSASTTAREKGFLEEMRAKFPGITIVSQDQYAGPTRETAKRSSENLLNRFGGNLQGVFTPNENSSVGMLLALQDIDKAGRIKHVGFDAGSTLLGALRQGQIQGLVVQNPMRMGYLGVRTMMDHLEGRPVPRRIDTGVMIVTAENMDTPEVKALLGGKEEAGKK